MYETAGLLEEIDKTALFNSLRNDPFFNDPASAHHLTAAQITELEKKFDRIVNCHYFWDVSGGIDGGPTVKGPKKALHAGKKAPTRIVKNKSESEVFSKSFVDGELKQFDLFDFMKAVFPKSTHATNPLLTPGSPYCLKGKGGTNILNQDFEIDWVGYKRETNNVFFLNKKNADANGEPNMFDSRGQFPLKPGGDDGFVDTF